MIGFYLTVRNNSSFKTEVVSKSFELFRETDKLKANSLYIFSDTTEPSFTSDGLTLYVVGTVIYKNEWNKKALRLISEELHSGSKIKDIVQNLKGQFCLVIHTDGDTYIITDKLGSFPIYRYCENGTIQISNVLSLLAKNNNVSFDFHSVIQYVALPDPFCYARTFYNEIKNLDGGTIYRFEGSCSEEQYYNMLDNVSFGKYKDLEEVAELAKGLLARNLSFLKTHDKIYVDLTGGFDTRTVATMLNYAGTRFSTGLCGEQILNESEIAKEVARTLGADYHDDYRIKDYSQFEESLREHCLISNGVPQPYHSTELINYYETIKQDHNIHLTGFEGTELLEIATHLRAVPTDQKVEVDDYVKRQGPNYLDILRNGYLTESSFYDFLETAVSKTLKQAGSSRYADLLTLLPFTIYSRYYHGAVIGTHNCILPHYSPFWEADFVKLMFETHTSLKYNHDIQKRIISRINPEAASIMTTHGYTATVGYTPPSDVVKNIRKKLREFTKNIVSRNQLLSRTVNSVRRKTGSIADRDRLFWVDAVNNLYSENMGIFNFVDSDKFNKLLKNNRNKNQFLAKIIYLNDILPKSYLSCMGKERLVCLK